jgi:hypothetical protein
LVKGQALCKLVAEAQDQVNEDPRWENEMELWCGEASYISPGKESWYEKLTYLLHNVTFPENLNPRERRALRIKSAQYRLINSIIFWVNYDGVILRCLECEYEDKVLKELHYGPADEDFRGNTIAHKIQRVGFYWPTLFKDAYTYARNCKTSQKKLGGRREQLSHSNQ